MNVVGKILGHVPGRRIDINERQLFVGGNLPDYRAELACDDRSVIPKLPFE